MPRGVYERNPHGAVQERFMSKVSPEPNTGCWLWTGALDGRGYGQVRQNYVGLKAHRASYLMFVGEIPEDTNHNGTLFVLHKCDVRSCVNPDHLFLGTNNDNVQDMINKGRGSNPPNPKGSDHPLSKLNESQARSIKIFLLYKTKNPSEIARHFKVKKCTISDIKYGRTWKHLTISDGYK